MYVHMLYLRLSKSTFTRLYEQCKASVKFVNLLYADLRNFNFP